MRIKIIHPTRNRPEQAWQTMCKWLMRADRPEEIDYILSVDNDDKSVYTLFPEECGFIRSDNKTAIEAINNAAEYIENLASAKDNYVLLVISDDTDCPQGWDTSLTIMCYSRIDYVAKVNDGLQPTLVTMPIMDREYYKHYGYVYHPDYKHMFCDQELTAVAIMTGKYIKLPLTFNHLHYSAGLSPKDALNVRNDATWAQGEALFNERLKTNFGIKSPVVPYSSIQWR